MGAGDALAGGLRRAIRGVRSVLPGVSEVEPDPADQTSSEPTPVESIQVGREPIAARTAGMKVAVPSVVPTSLEAAARDALAGVASEVAPGGVAVSDALPEDGAGSEPPPAGAAAPESVSLDAAASGVDPQPAVNPGDGTSPESTIPAQAQAHAPWSPEDLAQFRAALNAEVERLREELDVGQAGLASLIEDSGEGAGDDQADAGSKTFERENEMWVNANTRHLLEQVNHSLHRVDAGTYGYCESCGQPIAAGRLRAFPRATLCIACKQAEERR